MSSGSMNALFIKLHKSLAFTVSAINVLSEAHIALCDSCIIFTVTTAFEVYINFIYGHCKAITATGQEYSTQ